MVDSLLSGSEYIMAAAATPPVALAPDDPWAIAKTRFLRDLEPAERQLYDNATLENLLDATNAVNRDDAENSKSRTATRKLGPLISAIESYGAALDTIAQTAPLYLAPIWGSIRVVLVVAKSYVKFYDRIVDNLSRIGDVLPRFRRLHFVVALLLLHIRPRAKLLLRRL